MTIAPTRAALARALLGGRGTNTITVRWSRKGATQGQGPKCNGL
jgi:hypothetical protein